MVMAAKTFKDHVLLLTGTDVVVENESGDLYTGLLVSCNDELEVVLSFAQKLPLTEDSKFILSKQNTQERMKLKATRLSGDCEAKHGRGFRTDAEIGINGGFESDKDLQAWEDDGEECMDGLGDLTEREPRNGRWSKRKPKKNAGWSVDEMFKANKDKCVGESSFDENLTQYSNVEVGDAHTKEALERAEDIAKQIEMNPLSKRNALLENDDEERDLDAVTKFKEGPIREWRQRRESRPSTNSAHSAVAAAEQVAKTEVKAAVEAPVKVEEKDEQQQVEKKSKFTFNPDAAIFVPKQKDLNSNNPPPPPSSAVNTFTNLSSQVQVPTFVPMSAVPIPGQMMPQNIIYNNQTGTAFVYPQQQQAMIPNIPLYTYNPTAAGPQPSTVFMPMQPNQTPILIQQSAPQQQFIPVTTTIMAQNFPPQHSRTGTPTNGQVMHQQPQQIMLETSGGGNPAMQQPAQPTTIYPNPMHNGPVVTPMNTISLMSMPTMPTPIMQIPPNQLAAAAAFAQAQPPQQLPNGVYAASQAHHQQYQPQVQHQPPPPPPPTLSRSNSVQPPSHYQPQVNLQQQHSITSMYPPANPQYAQPLMQQQTQYQVPYFVGPPAQAIIPPATAPPPLTHALPPAGHGNSNMIGRQPHQQH